jgi:hypothetical protein
LVFNQRYWHIYLWLKTKEIGLTQVPFEVHFLLEKQLVDDVELPVNVRVFLARSTVQAYTNGGLVVAQQQG